MSIVSEVIYMKNYLGQIIFNLVTAGLGAAALSGNFIDLGDGSFGKIVMILLVMGILTSGNYIFVKNSATGKGIFKPSYVLTDKTFENLIEPKDYIDVMKDLKDYPLCRNEAQIIIDQWQAFQKKSETLSTISYSGGVYDVVNQDVQDVMLKNMVLFMKRAAILQSASRQDEINVHKAYLRTLIDRNNKILGDYTNLLIEASQLTGTDSANAEVESLQVLIDSIKNYRAKIERGDDNEN